MTVDVVNTYTQIMTALARLPGDIATRQEVLAGAREELTKAIRAASGDSYQKNDSGRWHPTPAMVEVDAQQRIVDRLTAELEHLTRQYDATCHQAKLHAAMMIHDANAGGR